MLVWIDLETTGLDPKRDHICEIGSIITTDELVEVGRFHGVRKATFPITSVMEADEIVREMHTKNGLIDDMKNGMFNDDLIDGLSDFITTNDAQGSPIAGSGVHFDRAFLRVNCPWVESLFHYRNFDTSVLNQMSALWAPTLLDNCKVNREIHRAIPDLEDAIETARRYRNMMFNAAEELALSDGEPT